MNYDFKYINFEDLKEGDELYIKDMRGYYNCFNYNPTPLLKWAKVKRVTPKKTKAYFVLKNGEIETFRKNDTVYFIEENEDVKRCLEHYRHYSTVLNLTYKLRTIKKEKLSGLDEESLRVLYKASQTIIKELGLNE